MDENQFRVIPVVDLKGGLVVHAIRGEREKYRPVTSIWSETAEFAPLVAAFGLKLGLREVYVADLDAIDGSRPEGNLAVLSAAIKDLSRLRIMAKPFSFMVDAGVTDSAGAAAVFAAGADKVIVGTETLTSIAKLAAIVWNYGSRRVIVSVDVFNGHVLSRTSELQGIAPSEAIIRLRDVGIAQFVLLELTRVGTGAGLDRQLITACVACLSPRSGEDISPKPCLFVGGGVSGQGDLKWLKQAGVSGALVATALHDGRLTKDDIYAVTETTEDSGI